MSIIPMHFIIQLFDINDNDFLFKNQALWFIQKLNSYTQSGKDPFQLFTDWLNQVDPLKPILREGFYSPLINLASGNITSLKIVDTTISGINFYGSAL